MITIALTDDEARMVIAALGYITHPQFIDLADKIQKTLWGNQATRTNPYSKDNA